MKKAVQINNRQRELPFPRPIGAIVRRCAEKTLSNYNLLESCELDISIVSARTIQRLNKDYRDIDSVTDVLSFPLMDWTGCEPRKISSSHAADINPQTGRVMLGDIIICMARAKEQAFDYGHSLEREVCFLTVHGILHLLGFDHTSDVEEHRMLQISESILEELGLYRTNLVVQSE